MASIAPTKNAKTAKPVVGFKSTSSLESGLFVLSNLAASHFTLTWPRDVEEIPPFMRGKECTYPTAEHAYQALKTKNYESARHFEVGALLDKLKVFQRWPKVVGRGSFKHIEYENLYAKKMQTWGRKAPGIAAKMVSNLPGLLTKPALGIEWDEQRHVNKDFDTQFKIWGPILFAKFEQNDDARRVLLGTYPAKLVETERFPKPKAVWSAFIRPFADGTYELVGGNLMGQLIEYVRDILILFSDEQS